jgi:hypothetical protein
MKLVSSGSKLVRKRYMQLQEKCGKKSPPLHMGGKRSQGGVRFPTGGNGAQCV